MSERNWLGGHVHRTNIEVLMHQNSFLKPLLQLINWSGDVNINVVNTWCKLCHMYTLTLTLLACWYMHHGGVANEHTWTLCTNSIRNQCVFLQVFILGSGASTTQNTCFSIVITWNWVRNRPSPPDRSIEHVNRHPEGQATVCRSETNDREQLLKSRVHESICGSCVTTTQNTCFSTAHT